MSASKTRDLPARLEGLQRRFERWRRTHRTRSRIPGSLWAAAARAAATFGLHRTSRRDAPVDYSLKERVEPQANAAPNSEERATAATFFELPPPADHGFAAAGVMAKPWPAGSCANARWNWRTPAGRRCGSI